MLKFINPLLGLSLVLQVVSGVFMAYLGPVHRINGLVLMVLLLAHVVCNRQWIISTYTTKRNKVNSGVK